MRIALLLPLLICLGASAATIEVPLRYQSYESGLSPYMTWFPAHLEPARQPPPGEWKLPVLRGRVPAYALMKLADSEFLIVLDSKPSGDSFYSRIYLDANANRDLTDDPEVPAEGGFSWWLGEASIRSISPSNLTLSHDGKQVPYALSIYVTCTFSGFGLNLARSDDWNRLRINMYPNCLLAGEFDYGDEHYLVSLCDQTGNGRFDDAVTPPEDGRIAYGHATGDLLFITTGQRVEFEDAVGMGSQLVLKDTLFDVRVDRAANKMTLTPVSEGIGSLSLPEGLLRLVLGRVDAKGAVAFVSPGTPAAVPAGAYRIFSYTIARKDDTGKYWRVEAKGTDKGTVTTITEGGASALVACEPLEPRMKLAYYNAPGFLSRSGTAAFDFSLKGAAGEEVVSLLCGGKNPLSPVSSSQWIRPGKLPTYKILSSDGQIVAQGQFEYG